MYKIDVCTYICVTISFTHIKNKLNEKIIASLSCCADVFDY